ncbi:MAG: multifunctional CCA addition/repair protein [Gammaproteobacteria bacterium]|nr:multifunctional CCA addition/repair protein [Gammaproteobacteria bacterium]MBU2677300.1 multifunctional CCA addition/repair protein [Gammaproteobacteria bacterium]NNC57859.1 multifunctional CCA addition/repair protein [Woeseiaceae bacterium]NNL51031.1 multifunctional CCA addition/repair protein [Woeseiaceae bacterium]
MQVYLVGGAVRDEQLGIPHQERDWCVVGATPDQLLAKGYRQVGKDFPVFLHPESGEEYALARTERKTAPGYHGFAFDFSPDVSIEDDLLRRDLTINAIAKDANGSLIDPHHGIRDIENRILRHVSDAFVEDPVRILRVAKFAARLNHLGFSIAPETLALMRQMVAEGEVDALVADRVWQETEAALRGRDVRIYIEVLRDCGALRVLLPEVEALFGVPQPSQWHPEIDTGLHVLMVLDQAEALSDDLEVRFAALMHDLGKGNTPAHQLPSHPGHEKRGCKLIRNVAKRLPVPNASRDLALLASEFHTHCHRALELRASTLLKVLERTDAFRRPQRFEQFLLTCEADARGRAGLEDRPYPQADYLRGAFEAADSVDAGAIAKASEAAEIPTAIRQAREAALKQYKRSASAVEIQEH